MRNFVIASIPFVWYYLSRESPLWGTVESIVIYGVIFFAYWKVKARLELIDARTRIEPVFVISLNPDSKEKVVLPEQIDKLCIHVPHKDVIKRTRKYKDFLVEAGNELIKEENLENRLPVIPILFRDGRNVNEEWYEFDERALQEIKAVRAEWHERMKEANEVWYLSHHHRQNYTG